MLPFLIQDLSKEEAGDEFTVETGFGIAEWGIGVHKLFLVVKEFHFKLNIHVVFEAIDGHKFGKILTFAKKTLETDKRALAHFFVQCHRLV